MMELEKSHTKRLASLNMVMYGEKKSLNLKKKVMYLHHHHKPGLLQTSATMAFQPSLLSVLLMSSLLGDSFLVTKLFRLPVYFVHCLPLLLVPQIFPLNIYFSIPSALFICPKICSCLSLMVLSRDLLYPVISITSSFGNVWWRK